jgi:isoleucyl-tRNA synthetase
MSKSRGNVVAPQSVMKSLGADVLRLWVSGTDYRGEMTVSDEILKRTSDVYRRLRNTSRFLLSNLDGFDRVLAIFDNIQIETTQIHGTKMMHFLVNYMELVLIIGFYGIVL